jgi:Spy/CpxP family protein refolding chaperone
MRYLTICLTLMLCLGTTDLAAQQHRHRGDSAGRGMGGMMGPDAGMMPGMTLQAFAPDQLVSRRADLDLADEQVRRLEQIQADAKRDHDAAMVSHERYRTELMHALEADAPDPTTIRGLMAGARESMGQAHWAEMHAALQAMGVLTVAQRAAVRETLSGGMRHRHGPGMR